MFTAVLLTKAESEKHRCLSTEACKRKRWYIDTVGFCSAVKNKTVSFTRKRKHLEMTIFRTSRQSLDMMPKHMCTHEMR